MPPKQLNKVRSKSIDKSNLKKSTTFYTQNLPRRPIRSQATSSAVENVLNRPNSIKSTQPASTTLQRESSINSSEHELNVNQNLQSRGVY